MNILSPIELKKAAKQLPTSPKVFAKLSKLVRNMDAGLEDITVLVNTDSSLTAQILRIANSAYFAHCSAVDTVEEAINRIGFTELYRLVGMATASQVYKERNTTYNVSGSLLWENSLACGLAMEFLCKKVGGDYQEAYTIGLLRSIGKMVVDTCARNQLPPYNTASDRPLLDWEEINFGINNPTVASFILMDWNFPEETSCTIEYQYIPEEAPKPTSAMYQLNICMAIAEELGMGLPGEGSYCDLTEEKLAKGGLDSHDIDQASKYAAESLEMIQSSVTL